MGGSSKTHPMYLTLSVVDVAHDERLREALAQIAEGPGVNVKANPEKTYTLSGNSESHRESICDRLRGEYQCAINVGPLKAVLFETIRKPAEAEGKYIRQTGASGNYGHCKLLIEPRGGQRIRIHQRHHGRRGAEAVSRFRNS